MDWYRLILTPQEVSAGRVQGYKEAFEQAFVAARGPRIMALFRKEAGDGGVELYFTPEAGTYAGELLAGWGCLPCEPPALLGLNLLVGHHEITYYLT